MALLKPKRNGTKKDRGGPAICEFTSSEDRRHGHKKRSRTAGHLIAGSEGALTAATGYLIETVEELHRPAVVEGVLEAIQAGNSGRDFPSSYASTLRQRPIKEVSRATTPGRELNEVKEIAVHDQGLTPPAGRGYQGGTRTSFVRSSGKVSSASSTSGESSSIRSTPIWTGGFANSVAPTVSNRSMPTWPANVMCVLASDILLARAPRKGQCDPGKALVGFRGAAIWRRSRSECRG